MTLPSILKFLRTRAPQYGVRLHLIPGWVTFIVTASRGVELVFTLPPPAPSFTFNQDREPVPAMMRWTMPPEAPCILFHVDDEDNALLQSPLATFDSNVMCLLGID